MIIDDFMFRYEREYDYYKEATRLCWQRCEEGLIKEGIRAIVTSRVKNPKRLRDKLEKRKTKYESIEDIYKDIVDLAGVRIALYFPGNRAEVDKFIREQFQVRNGDVKETFPLEQNSYTKRFSGYHAIHYRVHLLEKYLADEQKRFSKACIEIQVASVLMHAWAEVEHDLVYKPLSGSVSEEEHAILDEINGLVLAGEIALERLQKAVRRRIGKSGYFSDQYELAAYLYDNLEAKVQNSHMVMGRADILFRFLQLADLNHTKVLAEFVSGIHLSQDTSDEERTISDQLLASILTSQPELTPKLVQAQLDVDARHPSQALLNFLDRWITLEKIVRLLGQVMNIKMPSMLLAPSASTFRELGLFVDDESVSYTIERLRRLRNQLIHGIEVPDSTFLSEATTDLKNMISSLADKASEDTRQVIESNKQIQDMINDNKTIWPW